MTVLEKELGTKGSWHSLENKEMKINGEDGEYRELSSCDQIITPTKVYIIMNIAHLLQQNIETPDTTIAAILHQMKKNDMDRLAYILKTREISGPDKTYQLHNGKIRYSMGTSESKDMDKKGKKFVRPSATFITKDIYSFQPINEKFSKDSQVVYWTNHKVGLHNVRESGGKADVDTFRPLDIDTKGSNYGADHERVFHTFNEVVGAKIIDNHYKIIQNDRMEILIDSDGQFFSGHKKLEITHPERCGHVLENFLFDGENVYMISGDIVFNLTEQFDLAPGKTVEKIEAANHDYKIDGPIYRIGNHDFTYDGLLDIRWLLEV